MSKQESFKFLDKAKWLISLSFFVVAVVGNSYYTEVAFLYRVLGVVGLIGLGVLFMALTDFGKSSIKLMAESRTCLLYTSPSPRDGQISRMPSSA